jgi:hypothetical protein
MENEVMPALTKAQTRFMKDLQNANGNLRIYDSNELQVAKVLEEKGRIIIVNNIASYPEPKEGK